MTSKCAVCDMTAAQAAPSPCTTITVPEVSAPPPAGWVPDEAAVERATDAYCEAWCRSMEAKHGGYAEFDDETDRGHAREGVRAALSAAGAGGVPAGWVLVERSIVPQEVCDTGARMVALARSMNYDDETTAMMAFTEMVLATEKLAAAPPAAAQGEDDGWALVRKSILHLWVRELKGGRNGKRDALSACEHVHSALVAVRDSASWQKSPESATSGDERYRYALGLIEAAAADPDGMTGVAYACQTPLNLIEGKSEAEIAALLCENAHPTDELKVGDRVKWTDNYGRVWPATIRVINPITYDAELDNDGRGGLFANCMPADRFAAALHAPNGARGE